MVIPAQFVDYTKKFLKGQGTCQSYVYGILNRFRWQRSKVDKAEADLLKEATDASQVSLSGSLSLLGSQKPLNQLCNCLGDGIGNKSLPSSRSVSEIIASIQRSKIGIKDWSLSDLTIGLYLIYLRQVAIKPFEDVKGVQISSDSIVHDLIYHLELAKGSYKDSPAMLARNSML
ncbi:hypothetical protein CMV_022355 [Castanea mollissima]|uniref:Uncharacterized protein n=1 Tax=Castanea mollissima TaxID=60419 RepID=A0A8J4QJQ9_9ROSI|nr:hypothetical protein CMV_022355 [Castanea mollissima]